MRHLINSMDLSVEEIEGLVTLADAIMAQPEAYQDCCRHKILATLFFEPSTRTRLSFESAMLSLGGQVLGFSEAASSSASKGESVADTLRVVSGYADIIAMRHPREGAPTAGAAYAEVPLINAGDGGHYHPTQTLTDLLTIHHEKGHFDGLTIGLCGDLRYGRTVHSLIGAMSRYPDVRFVLISPPELRVPDFVKQAYMKHTPYRECDSLEAAIGELDILYMTRVQRERFLDQEEYERLKDRCILTKEKLAQAKADLCILHPLPRVNEISTEIDADSRAAYFRQARYGKFIRMALILKLLGLCGGLEEAKTEPKKWLKEGYICRNPHCITAAEPELSPAFIRIPGRDGARCAYCEAEAEKRGTSA